MVTQNPPGHHSPHKPTKVWKPKPSVSGEGVPSMFAHTTLSKPLKINHSVTSAVAKPNETKTFTKAASNKNEKSQKTTDSTSKLPAKRETPVITVLPAKPAMTASKAPSRTSMCKDAATTKVKVDKKSTTKPSMVVGGCSTVAGTPQSWPKPYAVPESEKPKPRKSGDEEQLHKDIDHLIPEMYRKKSTKQLEKEQQEEIQLMRRIMWELQQQEIAREEEALRCKPISSDVDATLNALKNVKKINDMLDDHASLDDSDATSKRPSAYSTHMKSKMAFFNSNHSVSLNDSDSDDSSSMSSWNSDYSDGLFRG